MMNPVARVLWRMVKRRVIEWLDNRALVLPESDKQYWARRLRIDEDKVSLLWDEYVRRRVIEFLEGL